MRLYKNKIVNKIRTARKEGEAIRRISSRFAIPYPTIFRWTADIYSDDKIFREAKLRRDKVKGKAKLEISNYNITRTEAKILSSLLYWCEGSKYPSNNFIAFSNSDVLLIKTFLNLLRLAFHIDESKIKIHLQLHTTHSIKKMIRFWSRLLKVSQSQFYKPTVTKPTQNMKRRNYFGTCTIRYYNLDLLLTIMGLYEGVANKI